MYQLEMPAKINLSLDVVGRREDGYHLLRMLMQTVSLCDTITVEESAPGVHFSADVRFLPADRHNLAVDAAYRFYKAIGRTPAVRISLLKRIPVAAGLAGGSADAAGVLLGLNRLCGKPLNGRELAALGLSMGADIPYCLVGGTQLAEGVGEQLTALTPLPDCCILLCKPAASISTASVFHHLHRLRRTNHPDTAGLLEQLEAGSLAGISRRMYNVLEEVTVHLCTSIPQIRGAMLEMGALGAVMSGSGPTVLGIFPDEESAKPAFDLLSRTYAETYLTRPVSGPRWIRR